MKKEIKANILLLITAAIWGFAFVAQRLGAEHLGAFTFNGIRFILGGISLLPLIFYFRKSSIKTTKSTFIAGTIMGLCLFLGATLQQIGVQYTTAGKASFITGIYIVVVAIFSMLLGHKQGKKIWISIILAIIGMYMLSVNESFTISKGDLLVLASTVFWASHILVIDYFTKREDAIKLSSIQFFACGILSLVCAFMFETISIASISLAIIPILYAGFCSSGIAYTLQVVAQKDAKPTIASMILSLESVFGLIGGVLLLGETLEFKAICGCVLLFIAIIIATTSPSSES